MTNEQLIQTAKEAMRNDTVLQRGIVDLLCQALTKSDEQVRLLTEQRDAVVSEFLQVKAVNDDRRVFIMNGVQLGYIKVPIVETDPALETIRIAVSPQQNTPTTSAILDSLRAEGVEMFAADQKQKFEEWKTGDASRVAVSYHACVSAYAEDFARQLRDGGDK